MKPGSPSAAAAGVCLLVIAGLMPGNAQSKPQLLASTEPPTNVRSVRVVASKSGPALEIISDRPIVPVIRKLENPPRLVVDLPNSLLERDKGRIDFRSAEVSGVRANQFQQSPPITRVAVDLAAPITYTWDAAGNRLMIRLHAAQEAAKPAAPPAIANVQPAPLPSAGQSSVVLAGSRVPAGSSVTAGSDTAVLRLGRGGEVRVCPGTTVSVTSSQNGRSLMLGMSTGALEANYTLDASADSILTPDFRILLAGPGEFHYGVSVDSHGNTCVQALPGNTASVIVSELLGDGTYQVKPTEQVVFRAGQLKAIDNAVPTSCGCPAPEPAVLRTSSEPQPVSPPAQLPTSGRLSQGGNFPAPATGAATASPSAPPAVTPETAALPPSKPDDVHVQVEAPFVFNANDAPPPQPAPRREVQQLPVRELPRPAFFQSVVLPPPENKSSHHGVFAKIGHFFRAIFS